VGLVADEVFEVWAEDLGKPYPWTGTLLRAIPRRAGATFELIGEANTPIYFDEAGVPTLDLSATTTWGDGAFLELAPGEIEVTFGGTATDCEASIAWPSDEPNAIRVPVVDGAIMYGSMRCGEQ
jgi:hypothetical protein